MQVLLVNGFEAGPQPVVDDVARVLSDAGHTVTRTDLAEVGFDAFMSAAERHAYHGQRPLVTDEARAAARDVLQTTAVVICYPVVHGTYPPRVKSWHERVFVPGVGFRFKPSGVITGNLDHLRRTLVVAVTERPPGRWSYADPGRSLARLFFLGSNHRCRARYLTTTGRDLAPLGRLVRRW